MWATTNVLVPTIIANGYEEYPGQDPEDPQSAFRRYLDSSLNELLLAGIEATNDLQQIEAEICANTGIDPAPSPGATAIVAARPNPFRASTAIQFDMPRAGEVRLEVFDASGDSPAPLASIPVGLDPVSVRARTDDEAWVVNHISDSISVVDLNEMVVKATILTDDEPADVIFAGEPQRAFVSLSQVNTIAVYDPIALGEPLAELVIEGEDPRALATDGVRVYAAAAWPAGSRVASRRS